MMVVATNRKGRRRLRISVRRTGTVKCLKSGWEMGRGMLGHGVEG